MKDILDIGVIGAGEISRRAHLPVLLNLPGVRVAWIHDQRAEVARAMADAHGIRAVRGGSVEELPPCDAALLAIPVNARGVYLEHFARNGTAVLCEKPFAMSAGEHASQLARFEPHALGCGYMRRFFRSTRLLRRLIAAGTFGPLRGIELSEGNRSKGSGVDSSFLDDPRLGAARGVLADLGSHGIDLVLYVSGATGFEVTACRRETDGGLDRKVSADIQLLGAAAHAVPLRYSVSWLDRQRNQLRLRFEHTWVWCDLSVDAQVYLGDPDQPTGAIRLDSPVTGASTYNQAFYLEWQDFLTGLRARRPGTASAASALLTTSLVEALLKHGETGP